MEVFVDFGLFELFAALGLAAVGNAIYRRPRLAFAFLTASIVAPLVLIFVGSSELARWLAAVALGTALVNAVVIFSAQRAGRLLGNSHEQKTTPLIRAAGAAHYETSSHTAEYRARPPA